MSSIHQERTSRFDRRHVLAILSSAMLAGALLPTAATLVADDRALEPVRMVIDYGDGVEKHFTALKWSAGMTVLDAVRAAGRHPRGIEVEDRGRGETAFLMEIDGLRNQGGGAESQNWTFGVNDEPATRSFGIVALEPGDVVRWTYGKYEP